MTEPVLVDLENGIARLTMNRADNHNHLTPEVMAALTEFFATARTPQDVRVVILTGAGEEFSAGVFTPTERGKLAKPEIFDRIKAHHVVTEAIERFAAPVIAAINGPCRAGGFELTLACDIRIAADTVTFQLPETAWGVLPGAGGPVRLPRIVGAGRAKEIMLSGRKVDAAEALTIGLVERVVPRADLEAEVDRLARRIRDNAPLGNAAVKQIVNRTLDMDITSAVAFSDALRFPLELTRDREEGITAFNEGRPPVYRGE